ERLRRTAARSAGVGVSARLRPGAQSGRVHLGLSQTPRDAQLLRPRPGRSASTCQPTPAFDAATRHARDCLLAAGGVVLMKLSLTSEILNNRIVTLAVSTYRNDLPCNSSQVPIVHPRKRK